MTFSKWCVAVILLILFNNVFAFGADGHQTVGAIADEILKSKHKTTYKKVSEILGRIDGEVVTLKEAAVWPDCARSFYRGTDNRIYKKDHDIYESAACEFFDGPEGEATLANYVAANYYNCQYKGIYEECHKSFHFADVPIDSNEYVNIPGAIGTNRNDIVHAINACIDVLKGKTSAITI